MSSSCSVRPSLRGSSCRYFASAMTRKSFMNSLGWKREAAERRSSAPIRGCPAEDEDEDERDDADRVERRSRGARSGGSRSRRRRPPRMPPEDEPVDLADVELGARAAVDARRAVEVDDADDRDERRRR